MSMMPIAAGFGSGIAFLAITAFTLSMPVGDESTTPTIPGNLDTLVIYMERTACFGSCPVYSVAVHGNGTINYQGHAHVAVSGNRTSQLSKDKVLELVSEFYKINYFALDDKYVVGATDLPSTTTSIAVNGTTKSVFRYGSGPDKLVQLEKKIDEIAGTDIWTKEMAVPRDFAVTYSFGVRLDYTLDTSKELFSVKMCNGPMQHATLALSDQELYSI